jgi:hypothetical protein
MPLAYNHPTLGTVLLEVGNAIMMENQEHAESLLYSHVLRRNGVTVHNMTERDGDKQLIQVEDGTIKLYFLVQVTLSFDMRKPTTEELASLMIYWVINNIPHKHSQTL